MDAVTATATALGTARTVTMLFTDIEGSTVLLRRLGPRWREALTAHREIVRAAIAESRGEEMGTEGDSFFVVFASAHDAVRAAVAAQRGLHAYEWPDGEALRVRMGLHTGEPERHGEGYIGEDVHLAARIGATSHGGQVVLSETTRQLMPDGGGSLAGVTFRDLGRHRLKDIQGDTHLYDVVVPGLESRFPPLRSLGRRAALPTPRTALVGRDAEIGEVVGLLSGGTRLLTLTGPGGCGKTRIALAAAAELGEAYPDGVYFVPLDGVEDADAMAGVVADTLDAPPGLSTRERLAQQLADRRLLLVLDNLEQIDGAELVVAAQLDAGPGVVALATSRRPLLLAGEQELPIDALSLPSTDADAGSSEAVELYVRAARLVRPGFALTTENAADVVSLVRQLDGLPLAIELAAANARLLGPAALASRLDLRLGSGVTASDRPDRHRTLGRTIEWSYDLLSPEDQRAFRRLGVFRGPASLDAVAAVVGEPMLLDSVGSLVTSSLIQVTGDAEPRLRMLETIKRFAVERLEDAGEVEETRRRHLAWCHDEVTRLVVQLRGPMHPVGLDGLAALDADARGAAEWALTADGDAVDRVRAGIDLVNEMTRYWYRFGSTVVARRWQERALAALEGLPDGAGEVDSEATVTLLHGLAISMLQHADTEMSLAVVERSLSMAERLGRRDLQARALVDLGIGHEQICRPAEAVELFGRAAVLAREAGEARFEALAEANTALAFFDMGRYAEAVELGWRSLANRAALGDRWAACVDRINLLGALLMGEGPDVAQRWFVEWTSEVLALRDSLLAVNLLEVGAGIAAAAGEAERAARVAGCADARRAALTMRRTPGDEQQLALFLAPARAALGDAGLVATRREGASLAVGDALDLVTSLPTLARTEREALDR
jgi:predicted ATPase/class 3 adenylate cyclase